MECTKCHGLMLQDRFFDNITTCYAWKCLNCGAVIDPTILENQRKTAHPDAVEVVGSTVVSAFAEGL